MTTGAQDATLQEEVVDLLSRLIRADTSNPPGDATAAARVLDRYFRDNGIEPTLVGESPELPNCVARVPGDGGGPSLLLLGHLDVVPADAEEWTHPPFSGLVEDGYVWGRGAIDMKNQLAAQAVTLVRTARRKRAGEALRGDLIFAATADEETGAHCGAEWLLDTRPELLRADFVLNEGGMDMFATGGAHVYTIHAGEKGYAACRVTVSGRSGHGSVPLHHQNAVLGLARVISALEHYQPEVSTDRLPARLHRQSRRRPQVARTPEGPCHRPCGRPGAGRRRSGGRSGDRAATRSDLLVHDRPRGRGCGERHPDRERRSPWTAACCPDRPPRTSAGRSPAP